MKRSLIILIFLISSVTLHSQIVFGVGFNNPTNAKYLVGKWIWVESSGGFGGQIATPRTENCQVEIEFNKKGIYTEWKDKQVVFNHKYKVSMGKTIYSTEKVEIISYRSLKEPITTISDSYEFKGKDTLILKNECHDCYTRVFVRKK